MYSFCRDHNIALTKDAVRSINMTGATIGRALNARPFPYIRPQLIVLTNKPRCFGNAIFWCSLAVFLTGSSILYQPARNLRLTLASTLASVAKCFDRPDITFFQLLSLSSPGG